MNGGSSEKAAFELWEGEENELMGWHPAYQCRGGHFSRQQHFHVPFSSAGNGFLRGHDGHIAA